LLKDPAAPRDFRLLPNTCNKPKIEIDCNLFISMFTAQKISAEPHLSKWRSDLILKQESKESKDGEL